MTFHGDERAALITQLRAEAADFTSDGVYGALLTRAATALETARDDYLEYAARQMELTDSEIRLMAGEMTAAELRTVKAVLRNRAVVLRRKP